MALKDGKPAGRLCALESRTHNRHYGDKTGFFVLFDSIEDEEVTSKLLDSAFEVMKRRGLETLRGPWDPSWTVDCGLLVEGFEATPFVMMPYNPPYQIQLLEKAGFQPVKDLLAFYILAAEHAPERIEKVVARIKQTTGLIIRSLRVKDLDKELRIIEKIFNLSWNKQWGYVPLSYEDLAFVADDLKATLNPDLVLFAEKDGVAVGFSIAIPNTNEFLWRARNSREWLRIFRFIWNLKTSHPKEARLFLLGVEPEYRNTGIGTLFYYESFIRGSREYIGGEMSFVMEENHVLIKSLLAMGGKKYKTYRVYETPIPR